VTKFTTPCNVEPSKITDSGTSVSIGELFNLPATGAATATGGKNSQAINFTASVFNSGTATAVNQNFRLQGEPVNNNTTTASGTLNVLFGQGTAVPAETGLKIAKTGRVTFAAGQTFPGTAGLATPNTFTANQSITGNLSVTGSIIGGSLHGNGSALTNVNAALLNGFGAGAFAFVGGSNTFTANQSISANLSVTGSVTAGSFSGNGSGLTGLSEGVSALGGGTALSAAGTLVAQTNPVATSGVYYIAASVLLNSAADGAYCYTTTGANGVGVFDMQAGTNVAGFQSTAPSDAIFISAGDVFQLYCYSNSGTSSVYDAALTATLINSHSPVVRRARRSLVPSSDPTGPHPPSR
jgi:hypothetical protein